MDFLHEKHITLSSDSSERAGRHALLGLLDELQTIAGEHADILHFGIKDLNKENDTWVLSKLRVEIDRWPSKEEKIILQTWPKGIDRLFAVRDFFLKDEQEKIIARAASYWLVIDRVTKRPKKISDYFKKFTYPDLSAIDKPLDKIQALKDAEYSLQIKVTENEIDINGHVNNIWYAHWILNTIPEEIKRPITCFEINYLSEVFSGESIIAKTGYSPESPDIMLGTILKDGKEACRVKIHFGA